ncbi:MAG: site-2 protease family protein [Clostridiales bacterium]|nr:site-2 protease family protein [Clostridiales bacterium]
MLFNAFRNGFTAEAFIQIGLYIVIIMFSLSFHELSHGYVAYRCGDATARNLGRLTLNPLSHLNPIGTVMMLVFGFGYATPVPVNPRNFNHYKRDLVFVSLAGPLSNVILAFIGTLVFCISSFFVPNNNPGNYYMIFLSFFISANAGLAVFNILPIPPLDGSRILSVFLPKKKAYYYLK